ncbi:cytochrome C biogenesis protein CycH [Lutibacter sp. HS1-25]|uniref:virulence protein RhuM/Fic/DOC family protein n=1 Tax=Lutibacter sp. HS1-25 TaxID=2485000 RepID=UPI00101118C6|nr:virulence protein RhuM/Fic/DOC family protein [Lutibacter sp. HS1-25]RXP54543.1 cytochrome C biogenesis protein CycH [Lutibacter sp. HS1-25]
MSEIIIYKKENQVEVEITYDNESLWLTLNQIAELFDRDKSVISRHIKNIFKEEELAYYATVAKNATVQEEGKRKVKRTIEYYNLDIILAVGYRVSSAKGTQFRIWANQILKDYLIKGFAVNEKRLQQTTQQLQELKKIVQLQENVISEYHLETDEAQGLIKVIASYSTALDLLDDYDHQRLKLPTTSAAEVVKINYVEARNAINELGKQTKFEGLFGKEKDDSFKGSLENIYQTFDGIELYKTIEEKAAHLLYFVVKNHSFTDGNKRIAAFLFVWFLERNKLLYQSNGAKIIADSTLVALTLMIAQSNPNEKDMMIKVIVNLLANP